MLPTYQFTNIYEIPPMFPIIPPSSSSCHMPSETPIFGGKSRELYNYPCLRDLSVLLGLYDLQLEISWWWFPAQWLILTNLHLEIFLENCQSCKNKQRALVYPSPSFPQWLTPHITAIHDQNQETDIDSECINCMTWLQLSCKY